jgi:hypothetical protein
MKVGGLVLDVRGCPVEIPVSSIEGQFGGKVMGTGLADLAYDCGERAGEHEGLVQEAGGVEGWV